jgi:hypothetical protein
VVRQQRHPVCMRQISGVACGDNSPSSWGHPCQLIIVPLRLVHEVSTACQKDFS